MTIDVCVLKILTNIEIKTQFCTVEDDFAKKGVTIFYTYM